VYKIIKLLLISLLFLFSSGCIGTMVNDDGYRFKNIKHPKSNDEVCIDGDAIARITLYDTSGNMISNSDTQKCFSRKESKKNGNRLEILYH